MSISKQWCHHHLHQAKRQIEQGLHHINESHNQLHEQLHHMYELQGQMHEKLNWLIEWQNNNEQFNCNASIGGGSSTFNFEVEKKQDEHDNSRNGSKVGNATKEILKNWRDPPLPSDSNVRELKPPAKSQSMPRRSKDQDNTTHKPRKSNIHDPNKTEVDYYKTFTDRHRGEPAAVNDGANAGLKNSNVYCYSNAILQCLASCICFSDFSPSENHTEFTLNHAFASLMTSMVGGEQSIDPSSFVDVFRPLFWPQPVEEEGEVNADEQQGMYYDFA